MFHSVQSARDPAGRAAGRMGEIVRAVTLGGTLVLVVAVLLYVLIIGEAFSRDASHEPLRIEVTARRSWWEVRYAPQATDRVLANELRVPVGRPVEVVLSADGNPESRIVLTVIAEESVDFDEWLARQSAPSVLSRGLRRLPRDSRYGRARARWTGSYARRHSGLARVGRARRAPARRQGFARGEP